MDVSSFGGPTKEYQVRLDPDKLVSYGLSIAQVEQQISRTTTPTAAEALSNRARSRSMFSRSACTRSCRTSKTLSSRRRTAPRSGCEEIATVMQGPKIRLGQIGTRDASGPTERIIDNPDTVEGIVLLQKGDDSDPVLQGIHKEVGEAEQRHSAARVSRLFPFLDRSDLVKFTVNTVEHNLTEGMILVSIILFLFLGNVRGAIVVALTIPFSLMFAAICLDLSIFRRTCFRSARSISAWWSTARW